MTIGVVDNALEESRSDHVTRRPRVLRPTQVITTSNAVDIKTTSQRTITTRKFNNRRRKPKQFSSRARTTPFANFGRARTTPVVHTNAHVMPKASKSSFSSSNSLLVHCRAVGAWASIPGMDDWCVKNCNHVPSFCPHTHCRCP